MSVCKFARKARDGVYEYGHWHIENPTTPKEVCKAIIAGTAPTIDEAFRLNGMALNGSERIGVNPSDIPWKGLY